MIFDAPQLSFCFALLMPIYDARTTRITASANPIVVAPRFQTTGLWKLDLDTAVQETQEDTILLATAEVVNAIFDLPSN
jgi:hypothetical protein